MANKNKLKDLGQFTESPFTVKGLNPKTDYNVSVKVTDTLGKSTTSKPIDFQTLPPSPVIEMFEVKGVSPKQSCIEVTYKISSEGGFDKVRVYANGGYVGNSSTAIENEDGTFTITIVTLQPNTTYNITIEAFDILGQITLSNSIMYVTYPVPPLITNIDVVSIGQTSTTLSIEYSTQSGQINEYSYSLNGGSKVITDNNPFIISGLTHNTQYTISVIVYDLKNQPSDPYEVVITTYPLSPVITSTTVGALTTVGGTVTTIATAGTGGTIKRYIINYQGMTVATDTNTYVIDDLGAYITYQVSVDVEDNFGQITKGSLVTFKTRPYPMDFKSYTVSNIIENGAMFEVDIIGSNGQQILAPLTKVVFYDANNVKLFENVGSSDVFYIYDLMPDTDYAIKKVIAYDEAGQTATNTTAFTIHTIPSILTISTLTATNIMVDSVYISCTYVSEANVKSFKYRLNNGAWVTTTANYFTVTSLIQNTNYTLEFEITDIFKQVVTKTVAFKTLRKIYAVDFAVDGGIDITSVPVYHGDTINLNDYITTKYAYSFDGWFIGTTKYTGIQTITANVTYTAHWTKLIYTVKFLDWNGTVLKTEQVDYGQSATAPNDPTRIGYTFTMWDKEYSNVLANTNVNATYTIIDYYLYFDANGGELSSDFKVVNYGIKVGALPVPTYVGLIFVKWNTKVDGTGITYDLNTVFNLTENIMLYAIYNANVVNYATDDDFYGMANYIGQIGLSEYDVVKPSANNTVIIDDIYIDGLKISVGTGMVGSGNIVIEKTYQIPEGTYMFVRSYSITGLTTNNILLGQVDIINQSTGLSLGNIASTNSLTDTNLVRFTCSQQTNVKVVVTISKSDVNITTAYSNIFNFELLRTGNIYKILNKGDVIPNITPLKLGFRFIGWYLNTECTIPFVVGTVMGDINITLYPSFNPNDYMLTYNVNGGNNLSSLQYDVTYGREIYVPIPTKDNSVFSAWKPYAIGYSPLTFDEGYIWNDDISNYTIYAQWDTVYNVGYPIEGGVTAKLDTNGLLEFIGSGNIKTFESNSAPWIVDGNNILIKEIKFGSDIKPLNLYMLFAECINLTKVHNIPEGVTNMQGTFYGCINLITAPTMPNSVVNVGSTYRACTNLTTVPNISTSANDMYFMFYGCASLTLSPAIPNGVTDINGAYSGCSSLLRMPIIPESVNTMSNAFNGCTAIVTANRIPYYIRDMSNAFDGCTNLTGNLLIDANNIASYGDCFRGCSTSTTANLVVRYNTNNANIIDAIIATKSANSKITKETGVAYKLTYNVNGGSAVSPTYKYVYVNTAVGTLPTPTKVGHTFMGWFTAYYSGTAVTNTTVLSGNEDKTIYAQWAIITYSITYTLNGGTNSSSNPSSYNIYTNTITLANPTRANYVFIAWFNNAGFTGGSVTTIPIGSTGNKTLFAKWASMYLMGKGAVQPRDAGLSKKGATSFVTGSFGYTSVYDSYSDTYIYTGSRPTINDTNVLDPYLAIVDVARFGRTYTIENYYGLGQTVYIGWSSNGTYGEATYREVFIPGVFNDVAGSTTFTIDTGVSTTDNNLYISIPPTKTSNVYKLYNIAIK